MKHLSMKGVRSYFIIKQFPVKNKVSVVYHYSDITPSIAKIQDAKKPRHQTMSNFKRIFSNICNFLRVPTTRNVVPHKNPYTLKVSQSARECTTNLNDNRVQRTAYNFIKIIHTYDVISCDGHEIWLDEHYGCQNENEFCNEYFFVFRALFCCFRPWRIVFGLQRVFKGKRNGGKVSRIRVSLYSLHRYISLWQCGTDLVTWAWR